MLMNYHVNVGISLLDVAASEVPGGRGCCDFDGLIPKLKKKKYLCV